MVAIQSNPNGWFNIDTINGFSESAVATAAQGTQGEAGYVPASPATGDSLAGGNEGS